MEEQTNVRLRMEVEQIVRPVRAIYDTQYKMLEELTHISFHSMKKNAHTLQMKKPPCRRPSGV